MPKPRYVIKKEYKFIEVPEIVIKEMHVHLGKHLDFLYSTTVDGIKFINLDFNPEKYNGKTKTFTVLEPNKSFGGVVNV